MMIQILFVLVFLVFFFIGAGISIKIIADSEAHVKHAREKEDSAYHYPKKDD